MKYLFAVFLLLASAFGQSGSGNITISGTTCQTTNACIIANIPQATVGTASIQLKGTFSGTLQFEASSDNGATWTAVPGTPIAGGSAVTSATSTGLWKFNVSALSSIRVRASSFVSGTAAVVITSGSGAASVTIGAGGSIGFDALSSGTNTTATMTVGTGASLGVSGSGTIAATSATTATTATTATNATNTAVTDDTTTNATMYPTWVTTTTGNLPQKLSSTKLTFNPSTATLTTTTFAGNATSANTATSATSATTATNATNGATVATTTNANFFPLFAASSTNSNQPFNLATAFTYNPSTGQLSIGSGTPAFGGTPGTAATTASSQGLIQISSTGNRPVYGYNAGTNVNIVLASDATTLAAGTSVSLAAPRQYYVCTSTCTVTPPTPAAGYEFCVYNDNNVATVITLAAIASTSYEATARTSYGTANHTFTSGGAVADKICIVGRDSTHYSTLSFNGTWTLN